MREIKIISKQRALPKQVKVAAYARVSSDKDSMLHSLSSQVSYYSKFIQANRNWTYIGVYSDEGETGTKSKRDGFQRLIQDAKDGKINIIITKSISRFARNTETLLKTIRELKAIDVDVFFQEQNIHTINSDGELLISILASYAQEEARTCSENTLWRVRKNFTEGKIYGGNDCMGYKLESGKFILIPQEAELVKRIFNLYEQGYGDMKIARLLNQEGIRASKGGLWNKTSIAMILTNINYIGDLILQKTYRENYITKKTKMNKGVRNQYLVTDDHEAIITKEQFQKVMEIRSNRKKPNQEKTERSLRYPFSGILKCGTCGRPYCHKVGLYKDYWICNTYDKFGKAYCESRRIRNDVLEKATCQALNIKEFTNELVSKNIAKIEVLNGNKLVFHYFNGSIQEIIWEEPKRSDGWTKEMRETVSTRGKNTHRKISEGDN